MQKSFHKDQILNKEYVDALILCDKCQDVLQIPYFECGICDGKACKKCAEKDKPQGSSAKLFNKQCSNTNYIEVTSLNCPNVFARQVILSMLQQLRFKCIHTKADKQGNRCTKTNMTYAQYFLHVRECLFQDVSCPNQPIGCEFKTILSQKDDLKDHKSLCLFETIQCKFCTIRNQRQIIRYSHEPLCLYREVCPKCQEGYQKNFQQQHKSECPKEEVECNGCHKKMTRQELADHSKVCAEFKVLCPKCKTMRLQQQEHKLTDCMNNLQQQLTSQLSTFSQLSKQINEQLAGNQQQITQKEQLKKNLQMMFLTAQQAQNDEKDIETIFSDVYQEITQNYPFILQYKSPK